MDRKEGEPLRNIMVLIENREVISKKVQEYEARLTDPHYQSPEQQTELKYRIAIGHKLEETGQVDRNEIIQQLQAQLGKIDEALFLNSWIVINNYIKEGGKSLRGGTGLSGTEGKEKTEEPEEDTE